jgi:major membrane immunogen (membrane-anchored lipoprotein)
VKKWIKWLVILQISLIGQKINKIIYLFIITLKLKIMKSYILILLSLVILMACGSKKTNTQTFSKVEYSVVGTWKLMFVRTIDGADTSITLNEGSIQTTTKKFVAENNTFTYAISSAESDLVLHVRGEYKLDGEIYSEYMTDKPIIDLIGKSVIYRTIYLNSNTWILEIINSNNINKKVTQYWKRV